MRERGPLTDARLREIADQVRVYRRALHQEMQTLDDIDIPAGAAVRAYCTDVADLLREVAALQDQIKRMKRGARNGVDR